MNKPRTNKTNQISNLNLPVDSNEFNEAIDRDFGSATEHHTDGFSRRRWLQLMGASLALGGMTGCRYEEEKIAPFAFRPQHRIPGVPVKYASLTELGGISQPILGTSFDGRPIKLDGNPQHPDSMGASTSFTQARILEFYDPDRLRAPLGGEGLAETNFDELVNACKFSDASTVAVVAHPTSSPSMMRLKDEFTAKGGQWFTYSPISDDNAREGSKLAFGRPLRAHYKLDEAKVIVSLDADILSTAGSGVANSVKFAKGRDADSKEMSRMYVVESQFSTTGAAADHRIAVRSSDIEGFAASLAEEIDKVDDGVVDPSLPYREKVLAAMASDLVLHKGQCVIVAGEKQSPKVHALVHSLNDKLGNHGKTITFTEVPDPQRPSTITAISDFAKKAKAGEFKTVIILGGNPVFDAPRGLNLGDALGKVEKTLHISSFKNETGAKCKWISAVAHPLASWKDGYANNGSVLLGQPFINPLFGGKSDLETMAILMGREVTDGQEIVRKTNTMNEAAWKKAVHDGFVSSEMAPTVNVTITGKPSTWECTLSDQWSKLWGKESGLEVVFNPSNSLYDGCFANSSWLQELPDFFTKVAWDNVASVSPRTAKEFNLHQHGMSSKSKATLMNVSLNGKDITIPVVIQPGQADGSIGIETGYGRTLAGRVGGDENSGVDSIGVDVNPIRSAENNHWLVQTADAGAVVSTSTLYRLAIVQEPWEIDATARDEIQARMFRDPSKKESDRSGLIREGSLDSYQEFLEQHPLQTDKLPPKTKSAADKSGALPIMNQVSYTPTDLDEQSPPVDDSPEMEKWAEGQKHKWPEAFHMHHELFDLTPGARVDYENLNPEGLPTTYENVWGMSIDLNKCIGCNSCVVACQAENNIPVVGKDDVWRGREMHWMRIDRYYGDNLYIKDSYGLTDSDETKSIPDEIQVVHQPVACHHCENAPCETVCPVAATVHSNEGLNDMVYNRCIGTRYCGNNCPYKVRRFNFFNYSDAETFLKYPGADKVPEGDRKLQNLMMNPEVTIRSRGVMEKCTYCVQRIQAGKIQAKVEHRKIGPNEITTACQDSCPTEAIKFGDLHNFESDVAKAHANPRAYSMLEELNNRPRTLYLARVRNPHESLRDIDDRDSVGHHGGHGSHGDDHGHGHDENHDHDADTKHEHDHDDKAAHDHADADHKAETKE
ncbi:MAG: 4Fe-4S dicluster domain-containing protein [Mariniblastus sp.]